MCENFREYSGDEFTGYKIVEKKDGSFFSVLTGNKYRNGKVPVWVSQRKGSSIFTGGILPGNRSTHENWEHHNNEGYFKPQMIGKTSALLSLTDARKLKKHLADCIERIEHYTSWNSEWVESE